MCFIHILSSSWMTIKLSVVLTDRHILGITAGPWNTPTSMWRQKSSFHVWLPLQLHTHSSDVRPEKLESKQQTHIHITMWALQLPVSNSTTQCNIINIYTLPSNCHLTTDSQKANGSTSSVSSALSPWILLQLHSNDPLYANSIETCMLCLQVCFL